MKSFILTRQDDMCIYRSFVITILIFFSFIQKGIGQTHVQTTTLFQMTTAVNIAKAFAAPSTTGNLIVVHLDWDGQTRSITSVTDNKGNTYARINGPTNWNGPNYRAELWYAYNITGGGGAITVTGHLSGAPTSFSQIYISEYSGIVTLNPLEQNSVAIGSTAAVSSGAKTTTYTNELIYGVSIGASGLLTVGGGFTSRSTANSNIVEDKNAAAIGSYNAAFTSASGNWVAQMATFISTTSLHVLPIELLSFSAQCNHNQIDLAWTSASELNNDYFTIERSVDGEHWNDIGIVKSAGNSSVTQNYSFTTDQTTHEISYFRLKQTDLDGKFKYFKIIQVNPCDEDLTGIKIYPNPSNGRLLHGRIHLKSNEAYSIMIFDHFGKLVSRFESVLPEFSINFPQALQPGVYYARIISSGASTIKSFLVAE